MSNYKFDIDFSRIVSWLIPQEKTRQKLYDLAWSLCFGVHYIYTTTFKTYVKSTDKHLSITPQVWSLEYHLNNEYDTFNREVYIEDGIQYQLTYIYQRLEDKSQALYQRTEAQPIYLGLRSESGFESVSFRVRIPSSLMDKKAAIQAFVAKYKLVGRTFDVIAI